jgi:hypothetical protein
MLQGLGEILATYTRPIQHQSLAINLAQPGRSSASIPQVQRNSQLQAPGNSRVLAGRRGNIVHVGRAAGGGPGWSGGGARVEDAAVSNRPPSAPLLPCHRRRAPRRLPFPGSPPRSRYADTSPLLLSGSFLCPRAINNRWIL